MTFTNLALALRLRLTTFRTVGPLEIKFSSIPAEERRALRKAIGPQRYPAKYLFPICLWKLASVQSCPVVKPTCNSLGKKCVQRVIPEHS